MKVAHAESIKGAVIDLQQFLECDLYSKFRPEQKLPLGKKGKIETWVRKDTFPNEKEFMKYLDDHFKVLSKEIIRLIGKRKYSAKNNKTKVKVK